MDTFTATDEQVAQLLANAVNASKPMGMGFLHYRPAPFSPSSFAETIKTGRADLDYVQGRMVKLYMKRVTDKAWTFLGSGTPRTDYQSWATTYPTYGDLLRSAGIELP